MEAAAMDGVAPGAEDVRSIVGYARELYDYQDFNYAGPYGDNGFLEDCATEGRGEHIGVVVLVTRKTSGQAQHIMANHWPRS